MFWKVIQDLEKDNSRLAKEKVLRTATNQFWEGVRLALDSYDTFGVKQIPDYEGKDVAYVDKTFEWEEFTLLTKDLVSRELTGNDARDAIYDFMQKCSYNEWEFWYKRILLKDLKCGVSIKTANKILKEKNLNLVRKFECQLAENGADHPNKIKGKKQIEKKLDGVRCLTIIDPNKKTIEQFSRNGKQFFNFTNTIDELMTWMELFDEPTVIDGEMISSNFQELMTNVRRKYDVKVSDSIYCIFDILPLSEFTSGKSKLKQSDRTFYLMEWRQALLETTDSCLTVIEPLVVDLNTTEGLQQMDAFYTQAVNEGFEGILIKDPDALYECDRTFDWLKLKPCLTVDLTIIDFEIGTGKNSDRLGAVIAEGYENGNHIVVSVGSGFTDDQREWIWLNRNKVLGQIIEVQADAITIGQNSTTYSLRFPRFKRFRGFEPGEKI